MDRRGKRVQNVSEEKVVKLVVDVKSLWLAGGAAKGGNQLHKRDGSQNGRRTIPALSVEPAMTRDWPRPAAASPTP